MKGIVKSFGTYISKVSVYLFHLTLWSCQVAWVKNKKNIFLDRNPP